MLHSRDDVWKRIDRIIKKRHKGKIGLFAKNIGFTAQRLNNIKSRKTMPNSLLEAIKTHEKISSDFILFGDPTPYSIRKELLED